MHTHTWRLDMQAHTTWALKPVFALFIAAQSTSCNLRLARLPPSHISLSLSHLFLSLSLFSLSPLSHTYSIPLTYSLSLSLSLSLSFSHTISVSPIICSPAAHSYPTIGDATCPTCPVTAREKTVGCVSVCPRTPPSLLLSLVLAQLQSGGPVGYPRQHRNEPRDTLLHLTASELHYPKGPRSSPAIHLHGGTITNEPRVLQKLTLRSFTETKKLFSTGEVRRVEFQCLHRDRKWVTGMQELL